MIDCHIHYAESLGADNLLQVFREAPITAAVLLCIPKGNGGCVESDAFAFREKSPVPVYIFGGISRAIWSAAPEAQGTLLNRETDRLLAMGCVGVKLLEGKPDVRKRYSVPDFDGPVWADFWSRMEREQIPVVFHVNDPEDFWDEEKVTEVAKKFGWFYDESFPGFWSQYRQVVNLLERHPNLRLLLPHFFFLSGDLERMSGLLDRYPNLRIDITPGIELYRTLSGQIEQARSFFQKHRTRICYGTDIGARSVIREKDTALSLGESRARIRIITEFIEKRGPFPVVPDGEYLSGEPFFLNGLGLAAEEKELVYTRNILNFINK